MKSSEVRGERYGWAEWLEESGGSALEGEGRGTTEGAKGRGAVWKPCWVDQEVHPMHSAQQGALSR